MTSCSVCIRKTPIMQLIRGNKRRETRENERGGRELKRQKMRENKRDNESKTIKEN